MGEAAIWQRRSFEHHLRTEAARAAAMVYWRANPVRHGFTEHPRD